MHQKNRSMAKLHSVRALKVAAVAGITGVAELILCFTVCRRCEQLNEIFTKGGIGIVFLIGLIAALMVLIHPAGEKSRDEYLLMRLGISRKKQLIQEWAVDFSALFMYLAVQGIVFCMILKIQAESGFEIILAIYGSGFINAVIPLAAYDRWLMLVAFTALLSMTATVFRNRGRADGGSLLMIIVPVLAAGTISVEDSVLLIACALLTVLATVYIYRMELLGIAEREDRDE